MKRSLLIITFIVLISLSGAAVLQAQGDQVQAKDPVRERLEKGLRSTEFFSYYLIDKAHSEPDRAKEHLEEAVRMSPNLPAAYFHLAWVTFTTSPSRVLESLNYFYSGFNAYSRNFWWAFNLTGVLYIGVLAAFFLTGTVAVFVRLPSDLPLLNHEIREEKKNFSILVVLLLISALGPLYFIGASLMIVSIYFKNRDIIVSYVFFIALILLPVLLKPVEMFTSAELSPSVRAAVEVNEGKDNQYAIRVLNGSEDRTELFSYALALKRQGRISEAIAAYNKLLAKQPNDPRIYNNLGNCYAIVGQLDNAMAMYEKANSFSPLVTAYYNLAQASRELLRFHDGDRYFDEARKLDEDRVAAFRENASRVPNLYFIDEVLGMKDLFGLALKRAGSMTFGITVLPIWFTPLIGVALLLMFIIFSRNRENKAYNCKRCGAIICPRCDRSLKSGEMCQDCVASLITMEKDPRDRIAKVMAVQDKKKSRKGILFVLTLIMPGSNLIYAGKVLKGSILTFFFIAPIMLFIVSLFYRTSIYPFTHSWLLFIVINITVLFYIVNIIVTRRLLKRWV